MRTRSLYILFCLLLSPPLAWAQQADVALRPAIRVLANPVDEKITLRWAPTTSPAWEYGNAYGYSIERVTIMRNNEPLTSKPRSYLSRNVVPRPLPQWEQQVKENKYAAVAAQAIYGKTFAIKGSSVGGMINKAKESDQRFSFALFSADYSPVVAEMSGLSFVDTQVQQEEHYLYKVWVNMPDKRYPIDTGFVYTGLTESRPLPQLPKPDVTFMDKQAVVAWNYAYYASTYIAYFIERSAGGGAFSSISKDPIVPTENGTPSGVMHVIDSLKDNAITYSYRIKGVSVFGMSGPYSPTVEGRGKRSLGAAPKVSNVSVVNEEKIRLQWEYPSDLLGDVTGFMVERSFNPKGPFEGISPLLKPNSKEYTDEQPGSANYYRVVALGADDKTYSFPHLAQLPDSIPPAIVRGVKGSIDSTGVVTLEWQPNSEKDFLGYRVFRSNFDSHEYTQVTVSPVSQPVFTDSVSLKTLTKNVYYKVVAVDTRFNPSELSEPAVLERPDVLAPAAASFTSIEYISGRGVSIQWTNSTSTDVKETTLYRRSSTNSKWVAVKTFSDTTSSYIDKEIQNKTLYEYNLIVVDDSGLASRAVSSIRITVNDRSNKPAIEKVTARQDLDSKEVVLSWTYDSSDVHQFWIYRNGTDGKMRLLESVQPNVKQFRDKQVTVNTQYQYSVKAVFKDGAHSPFSKSVKIVY